MECKNHNNREARFHCVSCDGFFCHECIKELKTGPTSAHVCRNCKGCCEDLNEVQEIQEEQKEVEYARDYWAQLKKIFKFPFNGKGPLILLTGTVGFTIATFPVFLMEIAPNVITGVMVYVSTPFVVFFASACFLQVLEGIAVSDKDEPPDLPDLFKVEDWAGKTFLFLLAAGLCLAPAMTYYILTNSEGVLFWIFFSVGFYSLPMFMLFIAVGGKFSFLNPAKVIASILNNLTAYSVIPILWLTLIFLGHIIGQIIAIERLSIIGFILHWFIFVYFLFVSMRPLGVFYRAYEHRLFGLEDSD